jgi:hypothetical protein
MSNPKGKQQTFTLLALTYLVDLVNHHNQHFGQTHLKSCLEKEILKVKLLKI